jgi:Flp pilus assembly protein protease CpaA
MPLIAVPWWAPFALAFVLSAVVLVIELRTGEIPNAITLGLLFFAGVLAILDRKLGVHFGGFAISALVTAILYRQDLLGGGTVKWTCALCTLVGARDGALMMFVAALIASIVWGTNHLRKQPTTWLRSSPFLLAGLCVAFANVVAERREWW